MFTAAFTGTLRLSMILPIAIAILAIMLLEKKERIMPTPSRDVVG
jgi:hypothetical protein